MKEEEEKKKGRTIPHFLCLLTNLLTQSTLLLQSILVFRFFIKS